MTATGSGRNDRRLIYERRDELLHFDLTVRRMAGESPLKIWRTYRGLTQEALAKLSKVSRPMIADIEARHRESGIGTLKKLAAALKIELDLLV